MLEHIERGPAGRSSSGARLGVSVREYREIEAGERAPSVAAWLRRAFTRTG